jgi:hypothetical protein
MTTAQITAPSEVLNAIILENLKAAANAEKLGETEEAKYYRNHASMLTDEIIKRGWVQP